jgi:TonB family protein
MVANRVAYGKPFVRRAIPEWKPGVHKEAYNPSGVIHLLGTENNMEVRQEHVPTSGFPETTRVPQLALEKTGWLDQFASSVGVLVRGPASPKEFQGDPYFRDCWIDQRFPKLAFAAAIILQILLIRFPPPIWSTQHPLIVAAAPRMELTWYGPVKDFPILLPRSRQPKAVQKNDASKAQPHRSADAYHPRQTIISEPLHPTHPRQTLIQPSAPPEPPKILPALPNLVQLAGSQPDRPKLQLTSEQLAAMRPKMQSHVAGSDSTVPDISIAEKQPGAINIASSSQAPPKPVLPVSPMSAPRAAPQKREANASLPDLGGTAGNETSLIALSATPAPVAPPPEMPAGNLSARVSISPDGPRPGATDAETPRSGSHGPDGIFITGGNSANAGPVSGLGIGSAVRGTGNALPPRPVPRARIAPDNSKSLSSESGSANETPKFGVPPEELLRAKRIYTLHVNMPNMTSASGSWVLNFAELNEADSAGHHGIDTSELSGPVPMRKVDPKYPPELRTAHVEGEVVLYAIIRKNGSVDSIQLVRSIDPHLDVNAMDALAQWKFTPAEKRGEPIDLEAVVFIPFRSRDPAF